jgi:hydroxymethylbilane synthase
MYCQLLENAVRHLKNQPPKAHLEVNVDLPWPAFLPREDVRDVFISPRAASLNELPAGSIVGTASLRRQAMVLRLRPDLKVNVLRGNVETRLRKLDEGQADAIILALAGLKRLGLQAQATKAMSVEEFLPAAAQGAIGIEAREKDSRVRDLLAHIGHADTSVAVACERAFLAELDGSCRTPIAGHATLSGRVLHFRGLIVKPDGSAAHETAVAGALENAATIGADAGRALRQYAGPGFFD